MIDNNVKKADLKVGDTILSVKSLCKYFGDNKVLNGINIDINKGDVVVVEGVGITVKEGMIIKPKHNNQTEAK